MHRSGLSAAQQAFALRARFPDATSVLKAGLLVWTGTLKPTPLSRSYRVEITYRPPRTPMVRVLDFLETREGRSLPHVYSDGTLCLHEPGEWTDRMLLAESFVPWTAEWLANYEIWLTTGDWHGGGEWPPPRRTGTRRSPTEAKEPERHAA